MAGKSEAIFIRNRNSRDSTTSDGPFSPSSFGRSDAFGFSRSMSVASDGTAQNSPPSSFNNGYYEPPFSNQRMRTHSFSGNADDDQWSIPLSTSAPGAASWRRSNSVSYAADKNLGRIDEHSSGRMSFCAFGDAIKKSRDKLFHPVSQGGFGTKQSLLGGAPGDTKRKSGQVKDQVVSMLCEGALR